MPKITFNSLKLSRAKTGKLKKTKTGKNIYVWRKPKGKKRRPSPFQIKEFKGLRSRAAVKRERERRVFIGEFKFHRTKTRNLTFDTYCKEFNDGEGIRDLQKLFRSLGLAKRIGSSQRIRFFPGSWDATCLIEAGCPGKRRFVALTKKGGDKYTDKNGVEHTSGPMYDIGREQPSLTNDNFIDSYLNYLISATEQAQGIYKSTVCPECGYNVLIEFIMVCFQVIKVRK